MKILYICKHNRCRSILSEAITNHYAQGIIEARSAGSQPVGEVHPLSIQYLNEANISTTNLQSQSWDEFEGFSPDVVVTVCDSAANETCPVWFGRSLRVHWGLSDPSKLEGTQDQKADAFRACIEQIKDRVIQLKNLAEKNLSSASLKDELHALGAK